MPNFIISWDAGYGAVHMEVDAENEEEAEKMAYQEWKEDVESNAKYSAEPYTEEMAQEYGL